MKIREILAEQHTLIESSNTNLLIIDVQPEYDDWCNSILPRVQSMIEKSNGGVFVVYNDFGGGDSLEDVFSYLAGSSDEEDYYDDETDEYQEPEQSAIAEKLNNAKFYQKEFGFLRDWMDQGVSDSTIIEVIRLMAQHRASDSRDLDYDSISDRAKHDLENNGIDFEDSGISMQEWVPVHFLKSISPFYMMGGGRNECLREIELFCNAFNIRYKRIDSLIY
jgi:hypothetical protein